MPGHNYQNRLGFHYFPDTLHYRTEDLNQFLPFLVRLGAGWITLQSHPDRAIPEPFLNALIDKNITPIIHIPMPVRTAPGIHNLRVLFQAYAHWGIKKLAVFDRPNQKQAWDPSSWSRKDLVERFLDIYLPVVEDSIEAGLEPVFPPLEPGGDYWDIVFLRSAIQGMLRRGGQKLIDKLSLSAYAWTYGRDLFWGKGGPEQWPDSRPYFTPEKSQDQLGFHIFDWYLSTVKSVLGHELPIFLLAAGCRKIDCTNGEETQAQRNLREQTNLRLYYLVEKSQQVHHILPNSVRSCNFWLLSSPDSSPDAEDVWIREKGEPNQIVDLITKRDTSIKNPGTEPGASSCQQKSSEIGHYILLPEESWYGQDWLYQAAKPLVDSRPVQWGASVEQALNARRITIIGKSRWLGESFFSELHAAGKVIEEIYGDGILIATRLTNL